MTHPRLELKAISKAFFGVPVLKEVEFCVAPGEVVGLVGENGAGKSTLMNIIGGLLAVDQGLMHLDGEVFAPSSTSDARHRGVELVHQELNLFDNLTILENLQLSQRGRQRRQGADAIVAALEKVGLKISPKERLTRLSPGERQLVEIAKAVLYQPRLLLLDEPTTSLTERETDRLFSIMESLRQAGTAIIYISHNLGHVRRICDQVVVLRDGEVQARSRTPDIDLDTMINLMVGREIEQAYPQRTEPCNRSILLDVAGVSRPGLVRNISFRLHTGEVLGISGLMGSGRTELARMLYGLEPFSAGTIQLLGRAIRPTPRRCKKRGMAFVTESRRDDGLLLDAPVVSNTVLASLRRHAMKGCGCFSDDKALQTTNRMVEELSIRCSSAETQPVITLSGGNQQKVVLAKWLLTSPAVVILDEPTRGIDVGARQDIYQLINQLAERGAGILLISSELEELIGMCDRILVMTSGEIRSEVDRHQFDRRILLREAFGEERLK